MRRYLYILVFPFLIFSVFWPVFWPVFCEALDVPQLKGRVNDYADMISAPAEARLEEELRSFEQSDSTQVVILTIPSMGGEVIEDFGIRVADAWKIGQAGKDNGVILIASKEDRKMRIEVGSGLEGRLTDLMSGRIIDLVMKPRFKRGDFDGGFMAGISALIDASRGEFEAVQGDGGTDFKSVPSPQREISPFFSFLIFFGIFLIAIGAISRILSSIAGAIGLPGLIHLTLFPLGLVSFIILAIIGMGLGFLFPLLSPAGGYPGSHRRGGVFQGGPGGGFYGTGGGGFGGGDSGGFSGGGGGFGGGGASGDW